VPAWKVSPRKLACSASLGCLLPLYIPHWLEVRTSRKFSLEWQNGVA
jgi:hypothetical protein